MFFFHVGLCWFPSPTWFDWHLYAR